jgi:hypothetical protein
MLFFTKTTATIILYLVIIYSSQAQETDEYPCVSKREIFGTQGRQEDRLAKKLIRKEYTKQSYNHFSGTITTIDNDTIKYDDEVLMIFNTCKDLKPIFQKGIFYPSIITGPVKKGLARKQELDSMLFRNDSLRISDFAELKFIKKSSKAKFFRFWLYSKGMFNPTVCFIELTNDSATHKTDIGTFVNGSKLTFFKEGWLIL